MSRQVANAQPLLLKNLPHQQAMLNNLVCGRSLQLQSQIHGSPCTVSLLPILDIRLFDIELQISIDGLPVRVQVARELFAPVSMGSVSLADLIAQLPDDLRLGCANIALGRLFADLRSILQRDIRLHRIGICEHISEGTPCLGLQFHNGENRISGLIITNDQFRNQLQELISRDLGSTAITTAADGIAMPLSLEIGYTVIADTRLQQLTTGDIILMDRCWYRDGKRILLRLSESEGYLGTLNEYQITLEQRIKQSLERNMSDDFDDFDDDFDLDDDFDNDLDNDFVTQAAAAEYEETTPPAQTPAQQAAAQPVQQAAQPVQQAATQPVQQVTPRDIQGLPVKLTFDIGQQELTIGDLGRLGPGYTFELNRDITSPVTMKANGKPFAECELVNINNQLGARIVRLL